MEVARIRGEIVSRVLDLERIADECETHESELSSGGRKYLQAVAKVEPDDDLFVTFNIPTQTHSIFITVSDGDTDLIRRVLSNLEQIEFEVKPNKVADVVAFDDSRLHEQGIVAVVLLPLSVSGVLCDLEESFVADDQNYTFRLVTFLSRKEYGLWRQFGIDALMSYFDETQKDLLTFDQFDET